ncbi:hypothetical protein SLEP1_g47302 [Rubroshorea leprosula]|uniref:Uncharacterized protein n=1 Tax=Rubroshorea leprosula TaxID=152421 RepID=A0AAV5LQ31_9ROSI|nr:hypothetical protein SLEP1_g47302 [Rubroshorea leprosula]
MGIEVAAVVCPKGELLNKGEKGEAKLEVVEPLVAVVLPKIKAIVVAILAVELTVKPLESRRGLEERRGSVWAVERKLRWGGGEVKDRRCLEGESTTTTGGGLGVGCPEDKGEALALPPSPHSVLRFASLFELILKLNFAALVFSGKLARKGRGKSSSPVLEPEAPDLLWQLCIFEIQYPGPDMPLLIKPVDSLDACIYVEIRTRIPETISWDYNFEPAGTTLTFTVEVLYFSLQLPDYCRAEPASTGISTSLKFLQETTSNLPSTRLLAVFSVLLCSCDSATLDS